jgi:hypothetical protein
MGMVGSYKPAARAMRLTFRFEGDDVVLVRQVDVDALPPPTEQTERRGESELAGFWFELQDGAGRTVYRRTTEHPIRTRAEVPRGDGSFVNQASIARSGSFSLLVPQVPDAREVVLFSSPLDAPDRPMPARELARTALRPRGDDPKGDGPGRQDDPTGKGEPRDDEPPDPKAQRG